MSSKRCNIDTSRRNAAPPWRPITWGARLSASVSRIGLKRCGFLLLTCSHGCAGPGPMSCCDCSKRFPEGHSSARSWTATSHGMEGRIRRHRASRSADCLNDGRLSFRPTTTKERTGVADAHGRGTLVAREPRHLPFSELPFAREAVHNLELVWASRHAALEPRPPRPRFLAITCGSKRHQCQGRIAQPAVAIVPVALTAKLLRQRRGGSGDDPASLRVGQRL